MGFTVFASLAVLFLCSCVSDAHFGHFGHKHGDFLRKECAQASDNEATRTDACIQCFNESRIEEQNDEPENEERFGGFGRPGPGLGFGRQYFDSTKLGECVKNYLGTGYTECSDIAGSQTSKIDSARILQCVFHHFAELVARQCASQVTTDDLGEFYTCQRNAFNKQG